MAVLWRAEASVPHLRWVDGGADYVLGRIPFGVSRGVSRLDLEVGEEAMVEHRVRVVAQLFREVRRWVVQPNTQGVVAGWPEEFTLSCEWDDGARIVRRAEWRLACDADRKEEDLVARRAELARGLPARARTGGMIEWIEGGSR